MARGTERGGRVCSVVTRWHCARMPRGPGETRQAASIWRLDGVPGRVGPDRERREEAAIRERVVECGTQQSGRRAREGMDRKRPRGAREVGEETGKGGRMRIERIQSNGVKRDQGGFWS
jgi:hypothetical protein